MLMPEMVIPLDGLFFWHYWWSCSFLRCFIWCFVGLVFFLGGEERGLVVWVFYFFFFFLLNQVSLVYYLLFVQSILVFFHSNWIWWAKCCSPSLLFHILYTYTSGSLPSMGICFGDGKMGHRERGMYCAPSLEVFKDSLDGALSSLV